MGRLRSWLFQLSAFRIALAVGLVATLLHWVYAGRTGRIDEIPVLSRLENIFYDLKFHERNALGIGHKPSGQVVVGAVDEKAIDTIGRWPWPRSDVASLIDRLTALGAKAIVFDVAYADAAYEGRFAAARKLHGRFEEISLAGKAPEETIARLTLAKTDAAGALEAARGLKDGSSAARDVKSRLEPVSQALTDALTMLERYRALHREYELQLAREVLEKGPDEQLADSIHQSGRVVLGSFLLTRDEMRRISPDETQKAHDNLSDVGLPPASNHPGIDEGGIVPEPSDYDLEVSLLGYSGAKSPLRPFVVPPAAAEGATPTPHTLVGFFNTAPDDDGVIRREPLAMAVGDQSDYHTAFIVPSLDLAGVLKYYDAIPAETRLWTFGTGRLGEVALRPGSARTVDGPPKLSELKAIPVDRRGQLLLNYYGKDSAFPTVSLGDVWNGSVPKERIDGRIVVIGATATGTFDQRVTPFDSLSPGVITHATAMENILHDDYLQRPLWALLAESLVLLLVALVLGRFLTKVSVVAGAPVVVAGALVWHAIDLALFTAGYAVVSFLPIGEMMGIYVLQTIYRYNTEEKEKRQIRRAFQFYLTKSVMEEMLKDPTKLKLGGDKKVLTVMFSDIRGFTSISEKLSPEQLAKLINEYLTPMTNLVFEHGGTLDKYIGDALMAIWGAPIAQEDHAMRCCRTAVAMMRELSALQERWRMEGRDYPPIDIGIGINSGPMVVGNMGADQRFDYTVLGDNVNLSSRLEGTNKEYRSHIIISQNTYAMCGTLVASRDLGAVRVKGKREPVKIYELLDDKPAAGELSEVIATFNLGVQAFREQRWQAARDQFHAVLGAWPKDGPSQAYLEFCDEYEQDPPGEGWDGVYTMTHK